MGCKFKDSSVIGCYKRVRVCPNIDTFKNCVTFVFNRRYSPSRLIAKLLKLGPEYSSDVSGDGPNRDKRDSKDRNETNNSDSPSESSDTRPPTPPKPRGMSKRNYKNMVRKHRKKHPKRKPQDLRKGFQTYRMSSLSVQEKDEIGNNSVANQKFQTVPEFKDVEIIQRTSLDKHRSDALRIKRAKRKLEDTESKNKARKAPAIRRKVLGPQARKLDVEQQAKRRKAAGPQARKQDIEQQSKRRKAAGPQARK